MADLMTALEGKLNNEDIEYANFLVKEDYVDSVATKFKQQSLEGALKPGEFFNSIAPAPEDSDWSFGNLKQEWLDDYRASASHNHDKHTTPHEHDLPPTPHNDDSPLPLHDVEEYREHQTRFTVTIEPSSYYTVPYTLTFYNHDGYVPLYFVQEHYYETITGEEARTSCCTIL